MITIGGADRTVLQWRHYEPDEGDDERGDRKIAGAIPWEVERQRDEAAIEFADGRAVVVN